MTLEYIKRPCNECPWRTDIPVGQFPASRFRVLAMCAEDMARTMFACHKTAESEMACAGFLLQQGAHNLSIRLARQTFDVSSAYPLHLNYRAMAIANGVSADDPSLRNCRDDGQMRANER